jgi:hypothetical protein
MNRKLINLLSLAVIALGASQLSAQDEVIDDGEKSDYQVCMDYCMPEYDFAYCHGQCKELADAS